jgi:hypothetical protein
MRFLIRGLLVASVCGLGGIGMVGCQENNETTAKITSEAPPPGAPAQPRNLEEYGQQQQANQAKMKKGMGGYPSPKR